jgi:hypothetical protein
MPTFKNKKILLISPNFFNYEIEIEGELKSQGAYVKRLPDRPFASPLIKALTRYARFLMLPLFDFFYQQAIKSDIIYDIVFVIQGEGLSINTLKNIRKRNPRALMVLYMWDSFKNKKSLITHIDCFDKVFTFDPDDAKKFKLNFKPLFFVRQSIMLSQKNIYDISFVGTMHSDRFFIANTLQKTLKPNKKFFFYFYLQAPWMFWFHKFFNSKFAFAQRESFSTKSMKRSDVTKLFRKSFSILDIEHPNQKGLTMRTFECLGLKRKLITTNINIKNYDFYSSNNIYILDRKNIKPIPETFFKKPYRPLKKGLYEKYSLRAWLGDILS